MSAVEPRQRRGIILMGHGSRDPHACQEILALSDRLGRRPEFVDTIVQPGWLEFTESGVQPVQAAFDACVSAGAAHIAAVPVLLLAAGHSRHDMPAEVQCAAARHPAIEIRLAGVIGIDDTLLASLATRVEAACSSPEAAPASETVVLLVASGSTYREANADIYKAARLLSDHLPGRQVEVAFLRLTRPFLQDAMARCARLGYRRVVVLPLFINDGLLAKRVPRKLVWLRAQFTQIEMTEMPHIGLDPALIEVLAARARAAFEPHSTGDRAPATPVHLAAGGERTRTSGAEPVREQTLASVV